MAVVGSAEIIVRAITKKVSKDIQKAFQDARPAIAAEGKRAGETFSKEFGKSLNSNLGPQINAAVGNAATSAANTLQDTLGDGASRAGRDAANEIDQALGGAGGKGGRRAGSNFGREFGKVLRKDLAGAFERVLLLSSAFELLGPLIGLAVAGVSSLTSGLFAMGAAASQAVAAIAVLPSLLAVAAQAFASVKLAFGGIGEALKLGGAAQDAAASGAGAAATAAKAAKDNTAALATATEALANAQEDATAAQDALNKARDKAKGGAEAQESAEARLAAAMQARNEVLNDPNASQEDGAAAQKAVDDAQAALDAITNKRKQNMKDIRKAAEENDAAQDKLSKAEKARDKAAKAGAAGAATSPAVAAANAFQDALAALTPEARAFVLEILEMRARFKELGEAIGKELFPPLTKALQLIGDSSFFKILENNLTKTGAIVGEIGLNLAKAFTTDENLGRFSKILKANNEILDIFNTKTKDGTTPAQSLVNIILKLFRAVQPLTKRFATFLGGIITGFDKAHDVADLSATFKKSGNVAAQLYRIVRNVFQAIGNLGGAGKRSGRGLIKSFEESTKTFKKFTERISKDGTAKNYFKGVAKNFRAISRLISKITEEFVALGDNPGVAAFADSLTPGVEALGDLMDTLSGEEAGTAFGDLLTSVAETLNSLTQEGQLSTFLETLNKFVEAVGFLADQFNKLPFAGFLLGMLAVYKAVGFAARIIGLGKAFTFLRNGIGKAAAAPFKALAAKMGLINKKSAGKHKAIPGAPTEAEGSAQGLRVGKAIADGIALGIREHTPKVVTAIDDLGDAAILAIKAKLGIASPSTLFTRFGKNTGEGFVLGIRTETDDAYKAGASLGTAAAAGARSTAGAAVGAGAVAGQAATPVKGAVAAPVIAKDAGKIGKAAGPISKLGKAFGALSAGLLGVSGPILLVIAAIVLLVVGLKKLYENSPEFKKFVDGIIDKFKDLGNWIKEIITKYVLPVLNDFFKWVNDNLPKLKKIFERVFSALAPIIGAAIKVIKFYFTKILFPVYRQIFRVIRALIPIARNAFNSFKERFENMVKGAKALYENVLKPTFNAIKQVVEDRIKRVKEIIQGFRDAWERVSNGVSRIGDGIKAVFTGVKDAIVNTFTGLVDKIKGPIGEVARFLNDNLIGPINSVTSKFGLTLPEIPGYAEGGWTGPGGKYKVAGVVHADEFVINKKARRAIESRHPGMLDKLNAGKVTSGFGGFGPIGDIVGGVGDLAGDVVGGIKNIGEKIAKEGLGKVLDTLVDGVKAGMGAAGVGRGKNFATDFVYGVLDNLDDAVKNWGGDTGKGALGGWKSPLKGSFPVTMGANQGHKPPWAVDFGAPTGSVVQAASSGRILYTADRGSTSYGKFMVLEHANAVKTLYAHLNSFVKTSGSVMAGQQIAFSGHSGGVRSSTGGDGSHLHFEIIPSYDTLEELKKRGVKLAKGGIAQATPGGILSVIAEAGKNERVEPLDSRGMSKRDKEILKLMGGSGRGDLTVNIHNPTPERAGTSVSKTIRGKAVGKGWGI